MEKQQKQRIVLAQKQVLEKGSTPKKKTHEDEAGNVHRPDLDPVLLYPTMPPLRMTKIVNIEETLDIHRRQWLTIKIEKIAKKIADHQWM